MHRNARCEDMISMSVFVTNQAKLGLYTIKMGLYLVCIFAMISPSGKLDIPVSTDYVNFRGTEGRGGG